MALHLKDAERQDGCLKQKSRSLPAQFWSLSPQLLFLRCAELFALVGIVNAQTYGNSPGPSKQWIFSIMFWFKSLKNMNWLFFCLVVIKSYFQLLAKKIYDRAFNCCSAWKLTSVFIKCGSSQSAVWELTSGKKTVCSANVKWSDFLGIITAKYEVLECHFLLQVNQNQTSFTIFDFFFNPLHLAIQVKKQIPKDRPSSHLNLQKKMILMKIFKSLME